NPFADTYSFVTADIGAPQDNEWLTANIGQEISKATLNAARNPLAKGPTTISSTPPASGMQTETTSAGQSSLGLGQIVYVESVDDSKTMHLKPLEFCRGSLEKRGAESLLSI